MFFIALVGAAVIFLGLPLEIGAFFLLLIIAIGMMGG